MVDNETPINRPRWTSGHDEASFDTKFRIFLAKDKRDFLGPDFSMTLSEEGCVAAYPREKWEAVQAKLAALSPLDETRLYYEHIIYVGASFNVNPDPQGRIVVPQRLREQARLGQELSIVGRTDFVEIWDRREHEKFSYYMKRKLQERRAPATALEAATRGRAPDPSNFPQEPPKERVLRESGHTTTITIVTPKT